MAIIYTYPIVTPTSNDLVLGTDVDAQGKPTKNFTIQSIIDLVTVSGNDLQAVLDNGNAATQNIVLTGNISATQYTDGTMSIVGGVGTGFSSITSTDFAGDLTGVIKAGSSIQSSVTGVTQNQGDNSTKLATTAYVDGKVDPSVLQYLGDATGPFDLNLVNDDFKIAGTANQIETTATTVAGNVGTVTLSFPTAGVTLPDGSVATTQAAADNTTKVATDAFVQQENNAQDLDFTGDTGTSSVLLNSQTLDFEGTTDQITTAVSAQKVKFTLPTNVTIGGTFTGTTFAGDLLGTINTATTGTTQTAGDDSTKIATTAYVDAAAGSKTLDYAGDATGPFSLNLTDDDLEFNGDSNITVTATAVAANKGIVTIDLNNDVTISGTMQAGTLSDGTFSGTAGTYTGGVSITSTAFVGALTGNADTATALASSGAIALTGDTTSTGGPYTYTSGGALSIATTIADTTVTGKVLTNLATPTSAAIAATDTILAAMAKLQGQINGIAGSLAFEGTWDARTVAEGGAGTPPSATPANGQFWIVSVAGSQDLSGITDWLVGDWAIYVDNGAGTDAWQKLDQSNEVLGSGAANKIAKWTSTNTLATGLIADDGTTVTVGNSGNLVVEGNTTLGDADTDTTTVKGPAIFEETVRINEGISLGANTYGTAGQVLTSGGGSASVNTWTTPSTGTVESVTAGTGITIGGTAVDPTVAIDYLGTDNAILSAPLENGIATTDIVWFSDVTDNNIKKTTVANLLALDGARSLSAVLAVGNTSGANNIRMADDQSIVFGDGSDLAIEYNSAGNFGMVRNSSGHLYIQNNDDDRDIIFRGDDGSGGIATYFQLDGSLTKTIFSKDTRHNDAIKANFGTNDDLQIYHDGTTAYIDTIVGSTYIKNSVVDADINLYGTKSDGAGGGTTELYFQVDSSIQKNEFYKAAYFKDNIKAEFGDTSDLQIYHDGSNSYINDTGTGDLVILSNTVSINNAANSENIAKFIENGAVELYYDNSKKFETTSTGIEITGSKIVIDSGAAGNSEHGTIIADATYGLRLRGSVSGTNSEKGGIYVQQNVVRFPGEVIGVSSPNPDITMMQINRTITGSGGNVLTIGDSTSFGLGYKANSVFQGDVDIKGDLTVDGQIIHGGSSGTGGGTFTGTKGVTATSSIAFTLKRAVTGTLVFDVYMQLENSVNGSVAKKYTVAHSHNTTPVYNKIIDTGPDASNDFTVVFSNATGDVAGDSVTCNVTSTAAADLSYTVMVGYDHTRALTFTAG